MNLLWNVSLDAMTASHSSGLTLVFDDFPRSARFGFVPSRVPGETSPVHLVTLMRESVEISCEACEPRAPLQTASPQPSDSNSAPKVTVRKRKRMQCRPRLTRATKSS